LKDGNPKDKNKNQRRCFMHASSQVDMVPGRGPSGRKNNFRFHGSHDVCQISQMRSYNCTRKFWLHHLRCLLSQCV